LLVRMPVVASQSFSHAHCSTLHPEPLTLHLKPQPTYSLLCYSQPRVEWYTRLRALKTPTRVQIFALLLEWFNFPSPPRAPDVLALIRRLVLHGQTSHSPPNPKR
jgi:hypothetical protein